MFKIQADRYRNRCRRCGLRVHLLTALYNLNQTTRDWHIRVVTLSETKGLSERFFASLRMTTKKVIFVKHAPG